MMERDAEAGEELQGLTSRQTRWLLLGILVIGLAWRFFGAADRSLWYDEAKAYFLSRFTFSELITRLHYDIQPPLYYLVLHGWEQAFGTTALVLRLPSVLFGTLAILGVYLCTVELLREPAKDDAVRAPASPQARETGLWAAALVSMSVFQIRAAWDISMYAVGAALAAFSSWVLIRALHARLGRYGLWLLYVVLAILFSYTHDFGMLTVAAQWIFVVGYVAMQAGSGKEGTFLRRFVGHPQFELIARAAPVLVLCWLPWQGAFADQWRQLQEVSWMPSPSWIMAGGYTYHALVEPEGYPPPEAIPVVLGCAAFCLAVLLALLWRAGVAERFVLLACLVPLALSLAGATLCGLHIFYSRHFLFAHLFFLVGVALLLGRIRSAHARMITGGLVLAVMFAIDVRYALVEDLRSPSYSGLVAYIDSERRTGEPVVVCDQLAYLPLLYHAYGAPDWYMWGQSPNASDDTWMAMGAENVLRGQDLQDMRGTRVWVVNTRPLDSSRSLDGSTSEVEVPNWWRVRGKKEFSDRYGIKRNLEVVEYEVPAEVGD